MLFNNGDIFLGSVILLFTIIFPILKYISLFIIIGTKENPKLVKLSKVLKTLGKWSMLDVFVIAMIILIFKVKGGLFSIEIKMGTIYFALSVMTCGLVSYNVAKINMRKECA
jgi:paraquat-inducible protein A